MVPVWEKKDDILLKLSSCVKTLSFGDLHSKSTPIPSKPVDFISTEYQLAAITMRKSSSQMNVNKSFSHPPSD